MRNNSYEDLLVRKPKIDKLQILDEFIKTERNAYKIKCRCDCGNIKFLYATEITRTDKGIRSCGCEHKKSVQKIGLNNRKYFIDTSTLVDNDTTAYIAGLLGADGWSTKKLVAIALQKKDVHILESIKNYFKYTGPIYEKKNTFCLEISSHELVKFFRERGLCDNKSYNYVVPNLYKYNKHFWRGILDGDGCLFKYSYNYGLSLAGTPSLVESFKEFAETILDFPITNKVQKVNLIHILNLTGKKHNKLYTELYNINTEFVLKRKQQIFNQYK